MHNYRVYCLGRDGKISRAHWYPAESLEPVIELVREKHKGVDCEIWEGAKCLAKVPAVGPSA